MPSTIQPNSAQILLWKFDLNAKVTSQFVIYLQKINFFFFFLSFVSCDDLHIKRKNNTLVNIFSSVKMLSPQVEIEPEIEKKNSALLFEE